MTQRFTPEIAEIQKSPWEKIRGRIAVAMVSLMGTAAVPIVLQACKASLDINLQAAINCRNATVERDGLKTIVLVDLDAVLLLGRSKTDEYGKIEGLLHFSAFSPLSQPPTEKKEYELPKNARPWILLVAEPDGRIILREKENRLVLNFVCSKPDASASTTIACMGDEIDPKKLNEELAVKSDAGTLDAGIDATPEADAEADSKSTNDGGTDAGADARKDVQATDGGTATEAQPKTYKGTLSDSVYIGAEVTERFKPFLDKMNWEAKMALARDLASVNNDWKQFVEDKIKKINAAKSENEKLNLTPTIVQLLNFRPEKITDVATSLGVPLREIKDAGTGD